MALGAETGTATINVSENLASSSLLDVEARSVEALRETGYTGTEEIVVRTLDEVVEPDWRRPLALKIDTQGFELAVLKGAQQPLADKIGRASCRERVCQYVKISVVAVSLKKKK